MIAKFPNYMQGEETDCGAACLRMICKHYGKKMSMSTLRDMTSKTRAGVSLLNLSAAAERLGFRTHACKLDVEQLKESINLPCILHWEKKHFVVLYKINKKGYFISDPAKGRVRYSEDVFKKYWVNNLADETGVALEMVVTPAFNDNEDETTDKVGFAFLGYYLRPYRTLIVQIFMSLFVGSFIGLFPPLLTQSLVDRGINASDIEFVQLVLLGQLVIAIGQTSIDFIRSWIMLHVSTRISISLLSDFLIKLMKLPIRFFDSKNIGDLRQRIDDNMRIQSFLTGNLLSMSFSIITFLIYSLVLAFYNIKLLFVFYTGSVLYVIWIVLFLRRRKNLDYKRFEVSAANQSNVYQLITSMQEIKLSGCEQQKRWEWEKIQARLFKISAKGLILSQNQQAGSFFINQLKNIIISFVSAKAVVEGEMTLGMMMSVQYILGQLNGPISEFIGFVQTAQDAKISLERMGEVYSMDDEDSEYTSEKLALVDEPIILNNLSFAYDSLASSPVLTNISLTIPSGKTTAIVGASGSGKTTLFKLILKFYPVPNDTIKIGSVDINSICARDWRDVCGAVLQDGVIFSDTILNNVALGEEDIDLARVKKALRLAKMNDFIESLPMKYNTKIGQEGLMLSQGQRQRILIARIIYREPAFLFFDEATNALDSSNEKSIVSNLNEYFKGQTMIVIAHRLSTVMEADQIVVLDEGRIVEVGKHDDLIRRRGKYYGFVRNQILLDESLYE